MRGWCRKGRPLPALYACVALLTLGVAWPTRAQDAAPEAAATPVDRGKYLVQAADCISCHTATNGQPFAGGKGFAAPYKFFGKIYASNITPDPETGIGRWTEDDFIRAMRTGVAPGGIHLAPVFPYTDFTKLTTDDLKAIFAYLRTIPAVHATPPRNSFIFQQRWGMAVWNALFFKPGEFKPDTTQSEAWNRGAYLVQGAGHCGACHTPRNLFLAERTGARFTGGIQIGEVEPGKNRRWSAPNLTAADSGLGHWAVEDIQKYLKTGHARRAGVLGPMNEVVTNSLQYLTDADTAAIAAYLKALPANGESAQAKLSDEAHAAGEALYQKHCEECHLTNGRGGFKKAPPVAGSAIVQANDPASLINIILYGAKPDPTLPPTSGMWEDMPGFKDKMTDAEAAQLASYLRTNWGNRGGAVSAAAVARQR